MGRTPYPLARVRNPLRSTEYTVHFPAAPDLALALCTCPDFARRGLGTCKHTEAARSWLVDHLDAEVPPRRGRPIDPQRVWAAIDRGERARPTPATGRDLRAVGAALIDEPA